MDVFQGSYKDGTRDYHYWTLPLFTADTYCVYFPNTPLFLFFDLKHFLPCSTCRLSTIQTSKSQHNYKCNITILDVIPHEPGHGRNVCTNILTDSSSVLWRTVSIPAGLISVCAIKEDTMLERKSVCRSQAKHTYYP